MVSAVLNPHATESPPQGEAVSRALRAAMEVLVLTLVVVSPWVFASVHPLPEAVLMAGVGLLLCLWAARFLVEGRVTWRHCSVVLCLAGLFLLGVFQIVPLSPTLLARLSPNTVALDTRLRPAEHEIFPSGGAPEPFLRHTLSLYPGATRAQLLELLAVLALFAIVRNNLATEACRKRLCVVALVNGALLSLFALVQFFTAPHHILYWTYPSRGQVFGPFICRNHFPFYVNLCVGLGVGLLLTTRPFLPQPRTLRSPGRAIDWLRNLLNEPQVLWICAALALTAAAVACSLSRGGFLALLAGRCDRRGPVGHSSKQLPRHWRPVADARRDGRSRGVVWLRLRAGTPGHTAGQRPQR